MLSSCFCNVTMVVEMIVIDFGLGLKMKVCMKFCRYMGLNVYVESVRVLIWIFDVHE